MLADKWIEIDVDAVKQNIAAVKGLLDDKVRLIAVVKANAYGHGASEIAHLLCQQGVDFLGVSFVYEALRLRKAGIKADIMLFSPVVDEEQAAKAIENNITLTVASSYDAGLISSVCTRLNHTAAVHLKVDTGLGRFGMKDDEIIEVARELKENNNIYIEGIYTHMAEAGAANSAFTQKQFREFMAVVNKLEAAGFSIPLRHCANSAVVLKYPQMHLDAVRVGTLLSGQVPAGVPGEAIKLVDPYKFKSRIISLHQRQAGSRLGYYRTYRLKRAAMIAVIPVGYHDGLGLRVDSRPEGFVDMLKYLAKMVLSYLNLSRFSTYVNIKGKQYPVRGKIFMQMALVELPLTTDIKVGDEVEVPVRKTLASPVWDRVYMQAGVPVKIGQEERTTYVTRN